MDSDGEDGNRAWRTGTPDIEAGPTPVALPAPDSLSLSEQLPSPRDPSGKHPDWVSSHDKKCEPSQAPSVDRAQYDETTWDRLPDQCSRRDFRRKDSKAVLKTRLTAMGDAGDKRDLKGSAPQDAPVCSRGIRERAPGKGAMESGITTHPSSKIQADGKRERTPAPGVKVSEIPAQFLGRTLRDRKRGRAPVKEAMDLDIPTQSFESTHGGVGRDTLAVGKGTREQAPVQGAEVPDNFSKLADTILGGDATDTSETLTGKRERAPAEGVMDLDIPAQSAGKESRSGDFHLAFVMEKEVVKARAQ